MGHAFGSKNWLWLAKKEENSLRCDLQSSAALKQPSRAGARFPKRPSSFPSPFSLPSLNFNSTMPQNLISFIFGKLGADATLPSIRNPLPPYKQLTLGDLEEKSDVFAGAMRKFGVGTQLVKGQIPRIGVWGGEWAPCEFAVSVLGIIRAGGLA